MHCPIHNIYILFRSNTMALYATHSASSIWVVGATKEHFQTSKLPSRRDVLKVLFYYHTDENMSLKQSIDKSAALLLPIWEIARIPTKARSHVAEHIYKLHSNWQALKKNINHSFIHSRIYIAPLQGNYSEVLPTPARSKRTV